MWSWQKNKRIAEQQVRIEELERIIYELNADNNRLLDKILTCQEDNRLLFEKIDEQNLIIENLENALYQSGEENRTADIYVKKIEETNQQLTESLKIIKDKNDELYKMYNIKNEQNIDLANKLGEMTVKYRELEEKFVKTI